MSSKWVFPPNAADIDEGLSNAGIETFRDAPYSAIARECGQNSLDAALRLDDGTHEQVSLSFEARQVPTHELPGKEDLAIVLAQCLRRATRRNIEKEIEFFSRAVALTQEPQLRILRISDDGTTGLEGPCEEGKPFHALVKASGVSNKSEPGAGGSFGIGKNAAFAVSELRTAFYSTIYSDVPAASTLVQGKAILASFRDAENTHFHAQGFWGSSGFQPLNSFEGVPEWLRRTQRGTTVTAVGFPDDDTWRARIAESLVRNFFAAVHRGRIRFDVDGRWLIDSTTLPRLFEEPEILAASEDSNTRDDLEFSSQLLRAMTSDAATRHEETFFNLGRIRLHVLVEDGLPKRVGILRNGMFLTDNLGHFPSGKFKRFALQRDFVAVIEPADQETSAVFRALENPKHDELSPERLEDRGKRRHVTKAFKEMIAWARKTISSKTEIPPDKEMLVNELNRFFASPERVDRVPDGHTSETDPERVRLSPVAVTRKRPGTGTSGDEGGAGGKRRNTTDDGRTSGGGEGAGKGGGGSRGGTSLPISELRAQAVDRHESLRRRVSFTPLESGTVCVDLRAAGMSLPESLPLRTLDGEPVTRRKPTIAVEAGQRVTLDIQLAANYAGPVDLVLTREEPEQSEAEREAQ